MVLNIISIVLQYSLIALVYYFLFTITKVIYRDLNNTHYSNVGTKLQSAFDNEFSQRKARLVVLSKQQIPLVKDSFELFETTSIGRSKANDIVIEDKFVSYEHACITCYQNEYWLSDLNSTNHTYLNGNLLTGEALLKNGDIIKIGAVTFKYER